MADLTPDDLAALRVPLASLPGFDVVGLDLTRPVLLVGAPTPWARLLWPCVRQPDGGLGLWDGDVVQPIDPANWSVDLSDAATRDRCARYLAQRVGVGVGSTAPNWGPDTFRPRRWWLVGPDDGYIWHGDGGDEDFVRALADLDPTDDRRLSDGSRWVDAAALAAVLRGGA